MANIADYLSQLQTLTQRNLEILQAINDSFYTKKEHLRVTVGDTDYAVPSFLSLENKINALQDNFDNLVYAPKTGEATFNVDGNSRRIEVKGYTCTPERVTIDPTQIKGFRVEQNDIFKDFLTPNPYIHIDLQSLPNDVVNVNVRKVAMKSDTLRDIMNSTAKGVAIQPMEWSDLWKILSIYEEDEDYIMYDTLRRLPIRRNLGYGTYTIKSIDDDRVDTLLDEYITLSFHEDLKYKLFDETIEKYIEPGDQLVTFDDSAKVEVVEVNSAARTMKVRVLNGDFLNLVADPKGGDSSDSSKMKFFCPIDYDTDKYLDIPLEEDRYICIFISPLNGSLNIQAPWGGGILVDTHEIRLESDAKTRFDTYYEENIRNVGDILYEMSAAMTSSIMKYTEDDYNKFTKYIPTIDPNCLKVLRINSHLNNSESAIRIRELYAQKQELNRNLTDVQNNINDTTKTLSEISFSDTTGVRSIYETQLSQYNARKIELVSSLSKVVEEINLAVNESSVPIEGAKYRIRGYYNWHITDENIDPVLAQFWKHVCGIKVQYRYKNHNVDTGTAVSIDDQFIYSDWNNMQSFNLQRVPTYNGGYKFNYPQYTGGDNSASQDNGRLNEPSFNQIDIPISQGESVDIRLKIVWDFGSPFMETTSDWSSIVNIQFPEEFTKDVQLIDIVNENTKDAETNKFKKILEEMGIVSHVNGKIIDQDVTYFHKPEDIASGFYTEERRIIPLRDKLASMDNVLNKLNDAIYGLNETNIQCTAIVNNNTYSLDQYQCNKIFLPAYSTASKDDYLLASCILLLQIKNTSQHTVNIYSIFPGTNDITINAIKHSKFDKSDYAVNTGGEDGGVYLGFPSATDPTTTTDFQLQTANQWITFRLNNIYTGEEYYEKNFYPAGEKLDSHLAKHKKYFEYFLLNQVPVAGSTTLKTGNPGLYVYPYLNDKQQLQKSSSYITLLPEETLSVPIMCHYRFAQQDKDRVKYSKKISFDIRTSLYSDPLNYTVDICANNLESIQEKIIRAEKDRMLSKYDSIISNSKYIPLNNE